LCPRPLIAPPLSRIVSTSTHAVYASILFFFFQAEDGIRAPLVTGVQTCALPICSRLVGRPARRRDGCDQLGERLRRVDDTVVGRSEERSVGKECRCRGAADR